MALCTIPEECKLDLWAEVIIAKDVQCNEPILGRFDEYGEPVPYDLIVTDLEPNEVVTCIEDFKIKVLDVSTNFICTSRVNVTINFASFFWVKTSLGFKCVANQFSFTKEIPVTSFIKSDGSHLTQQEFKNEVDRAEVIVQDYQLAYVNVLPKDPYEPTEQVVEIIITADIIVKLGKNKDVVVYGYVDNIGCNG